MASITTWARLEPHSRAAGMEAGLEMRVHDPLWMLTRQWQFGEFQGEDAGSPVWTRVAGVTSPLALYLPGPIEGHGADHIDDYAPDRPLEQLVEAERLPARDVLIANRRLAVEAGQHFLRLLGSSLATDPRTALLKDHAVDPLSPAERAVLDPDSVAFLDLVARRAIDGAKLLASVEDLSPEAAAEALPFDKNDRDLAAAAITTWTTWCDRTIGPVGAKSAPRSAWNPERMEYACALAAPDDSAGGQIVLAADEYPGGRLDWFSFDVRTSARLARTASTRSGRLAAASLPTRLGLRGMPAERLWEFEDAEVRFPAIEAGPTDLARLLLVGFLIEYDNDFFSIPLDVDSGTLVRVDTVTIVNTFGEEVQARPFADREWRLFSLSADAPAGGVGTSTLFLPPVLGQHLSGAPLEQVDLVRDEMANVGWAIERTVLSKAGRPLNRHEAYQAERQRTAGDRGARSGTLIYQLDSWESSRPRFWIPLVPDRISPSEPATMFACYDPEGDVQGQLLSEKSSAAWLHLHSAEIPQGGVEVRRVQQYSRWYDGQVSCWIGREKRSGRGDASSGLRYDVAQIAPED